MKDQCELGICWLVSTLNQAESILQKKLGHDMPLSITYSFYKYIEWYMDKVLDGKVSKHSNDVGDPIFEEGTDYYLGRIVLREFGVMPEQLYPSYDEMKQRDFLQKIIGRIQPIIDEFRALSNQDEVRELYRQQVKEQLAFFTVKFPKTFMYKNEIYTPQEFYQKYIDEDKKVLVVENLPFDDSAVFIPVHIKKLGEDLEVKKRDRSSEYLLGQVRKEINQGRPIWISIHLPLQKTYMLNGKRKYYINHKDGLFSAPNKEYERLKASDSLHAMMVVGYTLDDFGKINYLKIMNTYGQKYGDQGYYWMDMNYFYKFSGILGIWTP